MPHLTLETLARLLDEPPVAQEQAHLDACAHCRAELEQMREDVQSLSMLPDVSPAPDQWAAIEHRLTEEGLIRRRGVFIPTTRLLQVAAAIVLFLGGTMAGRMTADTQHATTAQLPPTPAVLDPSHAADPAPAPQREPQLAAYDDPAADDVAPEPRTQPRRNGNATLASNNFQQVAQANTLDEAVEVLRRAEEQYLTALTRYAELASRSESGDPVARLAAMQSIVMTTSAALSQTPMDPVINGYHLTALAQRDAALRQVAAATGDRVF